MPWSTPTLAEVRGMVRDSIRAKLPGADAMVPNSVLRILSDAQGGQCHTNLQYIDWLALQLLPDTAETEWLDRHGDIWLVNADGTTGRKMATLAEGSALFTAIVGGIIVPIGTRLEYRSVGYETTQQAVSAPDGAQFEIPVRALDPGAAGNIESGESMGIVTGVDGLTGDAEVVTMTGGTDTETDEDLRIRVLQRIRQPPQGGAAHDYVRWALAVPGCTRAWCAPLEMGIGTVTVRVLFDVLRADDDGWPRQEDLDAVTAYIDTVRPVAVKDFWVVAPIKQFVEVKVYKLEPETTEVKAEIEANLQKMMYERAAPGQTIFAAWKAQTIMNTANVVSFDMYDWLDDVMESPGHMGVLGDITYER